MIKSVAEPANSYILKSMTKYNEVKQKSKVLSCADSFCKHATQTAPTLLAVTTAWSFMEKTGANKIPFKEAFGRNFKGYFVPVLLASSAVCAVIENINQKK